VVVETSKGEPLMSTINLSGIKIQADCFGELPKDEEKKALIDMINVAISKYEGQPQIMNADEVEAEIIPDEDEEADLATKFKDMRFNSGDCPFCGSDDVNECDLKEADHNSAQRSVFCGSCGESWSEYFAVVAVNHEGTLIELEGEE